MLINHDTRCALDSVVDLLNTAPETGGREGLADLAALRALRASATEVSEVGALGRADLAAVHEVRDRFAELFATADTTAASALINAMVAEAGTTPRLTDHDGYDWHVHYFAPGASLADHLAADCGMALAFLVVAGERERLRRCDGAGLPAGLRRPVPQPVAPLLRQPHLREPAARGRLPGTPTRGGRLSPGPPVTSRTGRSTLRRTAGCRSPRETA